MQQHSVQSAPSGTASGGAHEQNAALSVRDRRKSGQRLARAAGVSDWQSPPANEQDLVLNVQDVRCESLDCLKDATNTEDEITPSTTVDGDLVTNLAEQLHDLGEDFVASLSARVDVVDEFLSASERLTALFQLVRRG